MTSYPLREYLDHSGVYVQSWDCFLTMMPHRLSVGKGKTIFNAVLVRVDDNSGQAISIDRIYQGVD